ncbi:retrovirus-related pol polyprotein from transposon TNT 1-94 [Tanacetum coccineum]
MLRHVSLEERPIVVMGLRGWLLGANPIPHRLARGVQFSTGRAVWHKPEQFSSELNNISQVDPVDCHDYPSRGYHILFFVEDICQKTSREYTNYLLSAEEKYRGRGYDKGPEVEQKQVKIMKDRRDKVQAEYHMLELQPEGSLSELNTVKDRIMNYGASFHANYCKEELERFKLRFGKVCLADDKTLDITGVGYVFLKTSFGTSWTLEDVRWFGEAEEAFLYDVREDKEIEEVKCLKFVNGGEYSSWSIKFCVKNGNVMLKMVPETPLQFGVAKRLSRTFRAESTGLRLRILKEEWRGKDTSLAHLKVFGCDSFVKVKDVCGEAMKFTFIGSGSDEMRYSFRDTKSHQVIRSRDITFVDSIYEARSATNSSSLTKPIQKSQVVLVDIPEYLAENDSIVSEHGLNEEYSKDGASFKEGGFETPQEQRSIRESRAPVKEEHDGSKSYKARLVVKGFQQKQGDVHQVGDEREVKVLRNFNWLPSELITEDGVLLEREDHLDAQKRKQHISSLECALDFEEEILTIEVQDNEATPLSDEEITLDAASQGTMASGSGGEEPEFDYDLTHYDIDD